MKGKRILIVEDDEASQYVFGAALRHFGFEVMEAWQPEDAVRLMREQPPDLVLMDVGLPRTDGFELTRQFKRDPATSRIPVVMVTVHVFEGDRRMAEEAGCDLFLAKPIEPRQLVEAVQQVLGGTGAPAPESD